MKISRRQFLQSGAFFSAFALSSPLQHLVYAQDPSNLADPIPADVLETYLQALEQPYIAPMNEHFEGVIGRNPFSLILYDVQQGRLLTALATENLFPVASMFKAPVLFYFLDQVSADVWGRVPVSYWNASAQGEVPEPWRDDWRGNQAILRALYQMIVMSGNAVTGEVLAYVARVRGSNSPIASFNDWARERVNISPLSALSTWDEGIPPEMSATDERFLKRTTPINGQLRTFENLMTARDMGLFYIWALTTFDASQIAVCREVLSTIHNERRGNLERLAFDLGGISHSKNGSLIVDDGTIITDGGLLELPDNRRYLLIVLSINAPTLIPTLFEELNHTLRGRYNEMMHHHRTMAISPEELLAIYTAHLAQAYPDQTTNPHQFQYGFILPEGVNLYAQPDIDYPVRNPIIRSTRFGIHLLMQGALIRFEDVDKDWVVLVPDDDRDNIRSRLGTRLFIKRTDIWAISSTYSQPIPYLVDPSATSADKLIVVNLQGREVVAVEAGQVVMRVPIALNTDAIPRGVQVITSKWFARSMQPWAPGVPFTTFYGSDGYALHGSPWQRWGTTVNQTTLAGRTSAGCVNMPDWMIQAGDYHRPADELLFRWLGGMENVGHRVFDYPSDRYPALRIYNVDYLHNLHTYRRPEALANVRMSWDDLIVAIGEKDLQAPDSFFV
jgi:hypothetical protein